MCLARQDSNKRIAPATKLSENVFFLLGRNIICANHEFVLNKLWK
jgi:hypothetical protein